jgi:hypothetical protein
MGWVCSTYGGTGEVQTAFWWGNLREGDQLEDPGINGRIIFQLIFEKWNGGGGGIYGTALAQNRDKWKALVNAVMNLWVP